MRQMGLFVLYVDKCRIRQQFKMAHIEILISAQLRLVIILNLFLLLFVFNELLPCVNISVFDVNYSSLCIY